VRGTLLCFAKVFGWNVDISLSGNQIKGPDIGSTTSVVFMFVHLYYFVMSRKCVCVSANTGGRIVYAKIQKKSKTYKIREKQEPRSIAELFRSHMLK
jgi:hypothetical protein